jgi:two-component system NarL family response regulator
MLASVAKMSSERPIRVAIVEDDTTTREALTILLSGEPGIDVVDAFADGQSLLGALRELDTDVLLTDLGLPDCDGPELIAAVKDMRPRIEVMAFTVSEARDVVFAALRAGATGYVLKGCPPREIVEALHTLAAGGAPMSPRIARSVVRAFQNEPAIAEDYLLSARERDVLHQLEKGLSYKEVGAALHISPHTVHSHIKKIYEKLHATSRDQAVRIARMKGLV